MKHFVILADIAVDNMGYDETHVVAVTHSLEEAKVIFAEKIADEKKYAENNGWEIYVDTDEEFDAGEDGFYAAEHAHFYIEEVE